MSHRLSQFRHEAARARNLVGLGQSLRGMTSLSLDGGDLYRSAVVHIVAALDSYVHGIVLDRSVDILANRINAPGSSDRRFGVPLGAVAQILQSTGSPDSEVAVRGILANRLSLETFQNPDDIAKALSVVGIPQVWKNIPADAETVKRQISLTVRRRNRIVHQCDSDPLDPGEPTALSDDDAIKVISEIESVVMQVDSYIDTI